MTESTTRPRRRAGIVDRASRRLEERAAGIRRALDSPVRTTRTAVVVGRLLGLAFAVCFATGLFSHFLQDPLPWMRFPTVPADLYRWTQGAHVVAGTMSIVLLAAKLWTVYPRLFAWPPVTSLASFLERASIGVLVASAGLQVAMGLLNTYQWYPWPFDFRTVHFALAWVVAGSLAIHVAVKLPEIRRHWRAADAEERSGAGPREDGAS